jgi:hypothetical protein
MITDTMHGDKGDTGYRITGLQDMVITDNGYRI